MLPHAIHRLPIYSRCDDIIAAVRDNQVVIVAGETGSGKSTVLPLLCREAGMGAAGRIAITEPRRIAATTLAGYVASLDGTPVGKAIGFKIRYCQRLETSAGIVYMTDGVLLASLAGDPLLTRCDAIIIDEAHERSLTIDFLLGYLRLLLPKRPELRLVIASATLDTKLFSRAFNHAPVITVRGRRFAVEVRYKPVIALWKGFGIDSFIEGAVVVVEELYAAGERGDILLFFPTVDDVTEAIVRLRSRLREAEAVVLPLHGRLSSHRQQDVFKKYRVRKIVVATNIAETSLTVPDVRFVIDTGLVRMLRYEPQASLSRMPVEKVSQASADQRMGRCGRVRDGICIRLYAQQDYLSRPRFTLPEIKRANLAGVILRMHALEAGDPSRFPFLQRPSFSAIAEAYRQLRELGALDGKRRITPFGRAMARFPLDPPVACMLLRANNFGALPEVMVIAAALSVQEPLAAAEGSETVMRGDRHPDSDFMTYLNVWKRLPVRRDGTRRSIVASLRRFGERCGLQPMRLREWINAHEHLRRIIGDISGFASHHTFAASYEAIHKSLLAGLIGGIAVRKEAGVYEGVAADEIRAASVSAASRKELRWALFHEIKATDRIYGTRAAWIDPRWVEELFRERCRYRHDDPWYDPVSGTVLIREEVSYRSLTLIANRIVACHTVDRSLACEVFAREALAGEGVGEGYRFIRCNRQVRDTIATAERKMRRPYYRGPDAFEAFYEARAPVATRSELDQLLRRRRGDSSLIIPVDALLAEPLPPDIEEYADELIVASHRLSVTWEHDPGGGADGATVSVPKDLADTLPQYYWEWQLPVFRKCRVELVVLHMTTLLLRKGIDPADVADCLNALPAVPEGPYCEAAGQCIQKNFGIAADEASLDPSWFPLHLWIRVKAVDDCGVTVDTFRPPLTRRNPQAGRRFRAAPLLRSVIEGTESGAPFAWEGCILPRMTLCGVAGQKVSCSIWSALCKEKSGIALRAFTTRNAALASHTEAIRQLLEERLAEPLAWEIETIEIPETLRRHAQTCGYTGSLHDTVVRLMVRTAIRLPDELPATGSEFESLAADAGKRVHGSAASIISLLGRIFGALERCFRFCEQQKLRHPARVFAPLHAELKDALDNYRRAIDSDRCSIDFLIRLPEFLDAFPHRCGAAILDPAGYRSAMREVYESRRLIDESAEMPDFGVQRQREQLEITMERYCIDQFAGAVKRSTQAVTAGRVACARDALRKVIEAFYRV
ncbi:MAG: ATP-dependent RNA helicase HrpA [Chitinispirillaceae bacterium]|nr:ATP-dependent RNA helicase HrpA [Chitinispirillaceae bacterium]